VDKWRKSDLARSATRATSPVMYALREAKVDIHKDVVDRNVNDLDDVSYDTHHDETDSDGL